VFLCKKKGKVTRKGIVDFWREGGAGEVANLGVKDWARGKVKRQGTVRTKKRDKAVERADREAVLGGTVWGRTATNHFM